MNHYQRNRACGCMRCRAGSLVGAAMVTTVGVLFLLDEFTRFGFRDTWPLLMIVLGLVKIFQSNAPTEGHLEPAPPAPALSSGEPSDPSQVPHV